MMNNLEEYVAKLNGNTFLREFIFADTKFKQYATNNMEELADCVLWIDDLIMIFQLKQRNNPTQDEKREKKWFDDEVIKKASKQIRNSLRYLQENPKIRLKNMRGHEFELASSNDHEIVKLILYEASPNLPNECSQKRHYQSSTGGGFIHILPIADYQQVCELLVAPAEIYSYFVFREHAILQKASISSKMSKELEWVHDFLLEANPNHNKENFDISFIWQNFGDTIENPDPNDPTNYYAILKEFFYLRYDDLIEVKKKFEICQNYARQDKFLDPHRVISLNGRAFLFMSTDSQKFSDRENWLRVYTELSKYDLKLARHIGISLTVDQNTKDIMMNSCFLEFNWEYDSDLAQLLETDNPF